jgi:hypothetical protein
MLVVVLRIRARPCVHVPSSPSLGTSVKQFSGCSRAKWSVLTWRIGRQRWPEVPLLSSRTSSWRLGRRRARAKRSTTRCACHTTACHAIACHTTASYTTACHTTACHARIAHSTTQPRVTLPHLLAGASSLNTSRAIPSGPAEYALLMWKCSPIMVHWTRLFSNTGTFESRVLQYVRYLRSIDDADTLVTVSAAAVFFGSLL